MKNQTIGFENIELLICDECSTDGSYALIQKWAAEYPNVKAFKTEKNSGAAGAPRNVCLDNATAPYIMFLDGDDEYFLNACEKLYRAITENEADVAQGCFINGWDENKKTSHAEKHGVNCGSASVSVETPNVYHGLETVVWNKIFKNEIIKKYHVRFVEGCVSEDDAFAAVYGLLIEKAFFVSDAIIKYNYLKSGLSKSIHGNFSLHSYLSIESLIADAQRLGKTELLCSYLKYYPKYFGMSLRLYMDFFPEGKDQAKQYLTHYKRVFAFAYENKIDENDECSIVFRDLHYNDIDAACFDFERLRQLNKERRTELDNIYGSTTWKIASALQKLKFWSK